MNYFCETCHGTGYVNDQEGHLDVCDKCWGLGYVVEPQKQASADNVLDKKIIANATYIMLLIIGSVYGIFYVVSLFITFSMLELLLILFVPYLLGTFGESMYVRHKLKQRKESGGAGDTHGH